MSALLSKLYSESPEQQFDFFEQFLSSYPFWDPSRICWDFLGKNFCTFIEAAFYVYRQTIWRETIFSKEYSSSYLFVTWRGRNLTTDNLVSALLTRLIFSVLELTFEIFFHQIRFFSSISGFQYVLLPFLAQKFRHSRQKCILRAQTNIWRKVVFRLENVIVFHELLDFTQKLVGIWWRISACSSELQFTCPEDHFEEKQLLERTMFFICFWNLEWKIILPGTTLFVHCWKDCVFQFWSSILRFFSHNFEFSHQFRDFSMNFFHI